MKPAVKKIRSKRGETLMEILVVILIVALASGLFAAMYSASTKVNMSAMTQDERFYDAVGSLEEILQSDVQSDTKGTVNYYEADSDTPTDSVDVDVFTEDAMTVYKESGGNTP